MDHSFYLNQTALNVFAGDICKDCMHRVVVFHEDFVLIREGDLVKLILFYNSRQFEKMIAQWRLNVLKRSVMDPLTVKARNITDQILKMFEQRPEKKDDKSACAHVKTNVGDEKFLTKIEQIVKRMLSPYGIVLSAPCYCHDMYGTKIYWEATLTFSTEELNTLDGVRATHTAE